MVPDEVCKYIQKPIEGVVVMQQGYHREFEMKSRFNQFIEEKITGIASDYYSRLTVEDFEALKTTLKDIHNIITYKTTVCFLNWLSERFPSVKLNYQALLNQVINSKPNQNGYDICIHGEPNIVAEVKCNKPISNGYRFGAEQKRGIIKDIDGLINGKSKEVSIDTTVAYKFMVFYDFGDYTLSAVQHHIKNLSTELKDRVLFYDKSQQLEFNKVYIVIIK